MGLNRMGAVAEAEVGNMTLLQIRCRGLWLQGTVASWELLASQYQLRILATVPGVAMYHKEEAVDMEEVGKDILTK